MPKTEMPVITVQMVRLIKKKKKPKFRLKPEEWQSMQRGPTKGRVEGRAGKGEGADTGIFIS